MVLSIGVLIASYWFNSHYIQYEIASLDSADDIISIIELNPWGLLANVAFQVMFAFCYNKLRLEYRLTLARHPSRTSLFGLLNSGALTYMCFLQTTICRLMVFPVSYLKTIPVLSILLAQGFEVKFIYIIQIHSVILALRQAVMTAKYQLRAHGIQTFLESHWVRLRVPIVLRIFWISRVTFQFGSLIFEKALANLENQDYQPVNLYLFSSYVAVWDVVDILKYILISGCETVVALLGMTSVVSYITHYMGLLFIAFLKSDNEEDRNMGTMSAILFFILALQTGLTGMTPEMRLVRLYRNFCLLSTAVLHFIHGMVHPQLMNLSASRSMSASKHVRALIMCFVLITFPCTFLYYLWSQHSVSTWLLAVTAFSVEVVIKVTISLLIYALFMIDAYLDTFWEKLDDYVYYIKSTGNSIEFLFGIFLFCNGAWIMLFESGGMIRALMMCIHAYFNIWVQAKEGWKVFIKRRTAVNKINSLPQATGAQLQAHNDVCAICYQELQSARITRCNHMFHGVCLRKWLYVQDKCPLCHELIYRTERTDGNNGAPGEENPVLPAPLLHDANGQVPHHPHED